MCLGLMLIFPASVLAQSGVVDPELQAILQRAAPDEAIPVIIKFSRDVNVRDSAVQAVVKDAGADRIVVLWIINSIAAKLTTAAVNKLAALPMVVNIRLDATVTLPERAAQAGFSLPPRAREFSISRKWQPCRLG
jgi:hypothetical protein